ncbi:MAG: radical SAM protein [Nitrospirota bacterium]
MDYKAPSFPRRIEIELVSDCNLRCVYCPRHYVNDLKGYINVEPFKKIVDEASAYPETIIVLHRRGESMLHPHFTDMLGYIAGKFKEVQLATNATVLNEDKFDALTNALTFISFSLDAPETYDKIRIPAKYHAVEKKILNFLRFNGGKVKTQASMVRTETTAPEDVQTFKRIWEGKVDRVRIYEEHSKGGVFGALKAPREGRKPCFMPIYELLIYDDGKVGRCNHDWNGHPLGDVTANTIEEVWNSEPYERLRNQHRHLTFTDPVCAGCDSWYPEMGLQGTGEVIEK